MLQSGLAHAWAWLTVKADCCNHHLHKLLTFNQASAPHCCLLQPQGDCMLACPNLIIYHAALQYKTAGGMFAPASSDQLLCHALQPTKLRPAQLKDEEAEHCQDASGNLHLVAGAASCLAVAKLRLTQRSMVWHDDGVLAQAPPP